jgi:hypothetical protein
MTGQTCSGSTHRIERKLIPIARIAVQTLMVTLTLVGAASALAQNRSAGRGVVFVQSRGRCSSSAPTPATPTHARRATAPMSVKGI